MKIPLTEIKHISVRCNCSVNVYIKLPFSDQVRNAVSLIYTSVFQRWHYLQEIVHSKSLEIYLAEKTYQIHHLLPAELMECELWLDVEILNKKGIFSAFYKSGNMYCYGNVFGIFIKENEFVLLAVFLFYSFKSYMKKYFSFITYFTPR